MWETILSYLTWETARAVESKLVSFAFGRPWWVYTHLAAGLLCFVAGCRV